MARRLADLGVGAIVSSDLPRARATADAIASATGLPVAETPLLQERNFGDLRGQSYDALGFNPLTMTDAPPNGEVGRGLLQAGWHGPSTMPCSASAGSSKPWWW